MSKGTPTQLDIQNWLIEQMSATLGLPESEIDVRTPFLDFGLGSLEGTVMTGELSDWLDKPVPPTLLWDYPTIEELSRYLAGEGEETEEAGGEASPAPAPVANNEPIAIVGIGCRFPGANGVEAFWQLLREGVDAITEVPAERFANGTGDLQARWGGFTDGVDLFDSAFFGITPLEAQKMDPQQRLLAEVAWEALEDAGCAGDRLAGSQTGVFVGISGNDYSRLQNGEPDVYLATGNAFSIAANRLSYLFDFKGPSLSVDTACSSSLVALHLACESLWRGETSLALAAGVNLILEPQISESFFEAGMLSPEGRFKTFDASANGYVRSEGVGVVVLKPLSRAVADGDDIYAVVRGTAVNQDGRSNGMMAPNRLAHEAVLKAAYAKAGIDPKDVQYIEAHGTGTSLGDPIEATALGTVLSPGRDAGNKVRIGSAKTNIGHSEAASGMAGLIKTALSLKNEMIPASLHFKEWNPYIPHQELPLEVNTSLTPWTGEERVAGVNAFGFGGTNAHVVLSPAPSREASTPSKDAQLLVLSAKTKTALDKMTDRLRDHLAQHPELSLADVAYTLQTGRQSFQHRRLLICQDVQQALEILDSRDPEQLQTHVCETNAGTRIATEQLEQTERAALLEEIGKLWLAGNDVPWDLLHQGETRNRVALPTYPFDHKRFWMESKAKKQNPSSLFYAPSWKTSHLAPADLTEAHVWLLFLDENGLGERLAERLRQAGQKVFTVSPGEEFRKKADGHYVMSPDIPHEYAAVWEDVRANHGAPDRVVHLWAFSKEADAAFGSVQKAGYYSLLHVARSHARESATTLALWVVANGLYQLDERDALLPEKATLVGVAKVLPQEVSSATARVVDMALSSSTNALERAADALLAEVSAASADREIAYRGNQRWVKQFEALEASSFLEPGARIREQGTYVILGGFGQVGQRLARYLAEQAQARLVLVGRNGSPDTALVQELEKLGARVLACQADVKDEAQMRNVLELARTEFGEVHGILHAAGAAGKKAKRNLVETDADASELHFATKIRGTLVLERLLREQPMDFCLIVSPLTAELGGQGATASTAAHHFVDAFVRQQNLDSSTLWVNVHWDEQAAERTEQVVAHALSRRAVLPFLVSARDLNDLVLAAGSAEPEDEEIGGLERPELDSEYVPPRSAIEATIVKLWKEHLGIKEIGIEDNFYDLGGNSLIGTKLVNRYRQIFQIHLPIQTMFDLYTVSELAATIEEIQADSKNTGAMIRRMPRNSMHPLSNAQERLWFGYQLGEPDAGNLYAAELLGDLKMDAFMEAVHAIIERHDIMRTVITERNGQFFQEVHRDLMPPIVVHDLSDLDADGQNDKMYDVVAQEQKTPFDLTRDSFFRINIFKLSPQSHVFLIAAHHIGYDGWSMTVFLKDMLQLYGLLLNGESPNELGPALQYADYAVWHNQRLQDGEMDEQRQYWLEKLAEDVPGTRVPIEDGQEIDPNDSGMIVYDPDEELTTSIRELAHKTGVTSYQAVLAALKIWLAQATRESTITVGTTQSGRIHPELEDIMGIMINPAALRTDLSGNPSGAQVLERVKETAYGAYINQEYPFDLVSQALKQQHQHQSLYHVVFMGQNIPMDTEYNMGGVTVRVLPIEQTLTRNGRNLVGNGGQRMFNQLFDLMVSLYESEDKMRIETRYNTNRMSAETARGFLEQFEAVLRHLVAHPDDRLSQYDTLEDDVLEDLF